MVETEFGSANFDVGLTGVNVRDGSVHNGVWPYSGGSHHPKGLIPDSTYFLSSKDVDCLFTT